MWAMVPTLSPLRSQTSIPGLGGTAETSLRGSARDGAGRSGLIGRSSSRMAPPLLTLDLAAWIAGSESTSSMGCRACARLNLTRAPGPGCAHPRSCAGPVDRALAPLGKRAHDGLHQPGEVGVPQAERVGVGAGLAEDRLVLRQCRVHIHRQAVEVAKGGHGPHLAVGHRGATLLLG